MKEVFSFITAIICDRERPRTKQRIPSIIVCAHESLFKEDTDKVIETDGTGDAGECGL